MKINEMVCDNSFAIRKLSDNLNSYESLLNMQKSLTDMPHAGFAWTVEWSSGRHICVCVNV